VEPNSEPEMSVPRLCRTGASTSRSSSFVASRRSEVTVVPSSGSTLEDADAFDVVVVDELRGKRAG
jgi:hypothetical protein